MTGLFPKLLSLAELIIGLEYMQSSCLGIMGTGIRRFIGVDRSGIGISSSFLVHNVRYLLDGENTSFVDTDLLTDVA